jgi:hypothetical protein
MPLGHEDRTKSAAVLLQRGCMICFTKQDMDPAPLCSESSAQWLFMQRFDGYITCEKSMVRGLPT